MRLPLGFHVGFDVTQLRHALFQRVDRLQPLGANLGQIAFSVLLFQKPQLVLLERGAGVQGVVLGGHFGLLFQFFQVAGQLAQDVFDAGEVLLRVVQAVLRLAAALFVFGDASGFFQKQAQLLGAAFNDAADRALTNDGVRTRPQTGTQKHVLHVAAAHRLVVDEVVAATVAGEYALDSDLGELIPLPTGAVVAVVKIEFHAGAAGRFALGGAVEDHVLHGLATQLARLGLAQHPAHGVHDVGLAATVGAHHPHQLPRQHEVGRLSKRFEARELDGLKAHGDVRTDKAPTPKREGAQMIQPDKPSAPEVAL